MVVEIVNITPIASIVIVQQANRTRTEKHDGADGLLFYLCFKFRKKINTFLYVCVCVCIQKPEILTASDGRVVDHDTRPFRLAQIKLDTNCRFAHKCCVCLCARTKKNKYIYVLSEMMQNRILVARRAATCRLGSWRPTGEVPLHLGRAMMMMHTSWSLASDTPLKTPVHISLSLSLSNLPALNT
jgi:hypothetical protein